MMRTILLIARRELSSYLNSMSGYVIIAVMLFIDGLLFNAFAVSSAAKQSGVVLADFFTLTSGITMAGAVFLSMRLIAEEWQSGSIALLFSSPVHDIEIVLGKFLASLGFLSLFFVSTIYMPLLVAAYGKVSLGYIISGYTGVTLVGAASLGIGLLGSALARNQVVAAVISGVACLALTTCWLLSEITSSPLTGIVTSLAWWHHFDAFRGGVIHLKHISYFGFVTFFALFAAARVLEARRWR